MSHHCICPSQQIESLIAATGPILNGYKTGGFLSQFYLLYLINPQLNLAFHDDQRGCVYF